MHDSPGSCKHAANQRRRRQPSPPSPPPPQPLHAIHSSPSSLLTLAPSAIVHTDPTIHPPPSRIAVAGVDGGTEGIRAGVFDLAGTPLSFSSQPYPTAFPSPGWAEQDPADWWAGLGAAVRAAVAAAGVQSTDIAAISVGEPRAARCTLACYRRLPTDSTCAISVS